MITLQDKLNRPLHDLRISVTDRCNFRCQYCMPAEVFGPDFSFLPQNEVLSFEEIERLAKIFADLGVKKLRLTGGEPLLRKDLPLLIKRLGHISGITDMGLTTNGVLLTKQANDLYDAGLRRLNISLDAIDDEIFKQINGRNVSTKIVLDGIQYASDIGFQVKVNMVVQRDVNESQIIPMANYFHDKGITLRFIEFMDVGNSNEWKWDKVITKKEIYNTLSSHFTLEPVEASYFGEVARRYRYKDTDAEIGFITSVSESFCSSCTRARLSANGKLYTCLFASDGVDLRALLRDGSPDEKIKTTIMTIWNERNDRYSDLRLENENRLKEKIEMSFIGG